MKKSQKLIFLIVFLIINLAIILIFQSGDDMKMINWIEILWIEFQIQLIYSQFNKLS
jgi:hypothetical protein